MFQFTRRRHLMKVRALLEGRMNRAYVRHLDEGDRHGVRGAICEVAFLVPYGSDKSVDVEAATPVLTRDTSWAGLSILHREPVDAETESVVVVLETEAGFKFLHCLVEHSTSLGFGFYQIGLQPTRILDVDESTLEAFERRRRELAKSCEPAPEALGV